VLSPLAAGADVRAAADTLANAAGAASVVMLPVGNGTWWSWLSWPSPPGADRLRRVRDTPTRDIVVGMGEIGYGRMGFARSHQQARDADRVARLIPNVRGGVVPHRDVARCASTSAAPGSSPRIASPR
jgi:hypothetical protein